MADGLLDSNAETQRAACEGVKDIHEVSIIWGEAPVGVFALEVGTSGIQTFRQRRGGPTLHDFIVVVIALKQTSEIFCLVYR